MKKCVSGTGGPSRKKKGVNEGGGADESFRGMVTRKAFRFVSKTIKWLTPIMRNDMERKMLLMCHL